ncbi:MAG: FAD-binding oxidoreductase [Candidatus Nanopelagicales bacterium]
MTTSGHHLDDLRDRIHGEVLLPGDPAYDASRSVWNAMVDRRPRLIVRCAVVDDVVAAVRTARELGLEIGVRCGGHSVVGLAVPEDGLMIDLTPMRAVRVDPVARIARVQGGALLGVLDAAAQEHGLATTAGNVSHTGVGGLTLGGGMGWLARQHGLTCDNVLSFELVTADGSRVRASADENAELFWGLRGGGGNFGVVTDFALQLHPLTGPMLSVEVDVSIDDAEHALRDWRDLSFDAPREGTFAASIANGVAMVGFVWTGAPERGRALIPSLRSIARRPLAERITTPSYIRLQSREDTVEGHAIRRYWKGHYFRALTDDVIAGLVTGTSDPYAPAVSLQAYGGAIASVPDDATAFSHRDVAFELVAAAGWTDAAEDAERIEGARRFAAPLEPFASGAYVNVLSDEGQHGVRRAYSPAKLARLTALKDGYDPDNAFHLNHNIRPTAQSKGQ